MVLVSEWENPLQRNTIVYGIIWLQDADRLATARGSYSLRRHYCVSRGCKPRGLGVTYKRSLRYNITAWLALVTGTGIGI